MTLQWNQFWHVAPESARESIERHGIDIRRGRPVWDEYGSDLGGRSNFMWKNVNDARTYQHMANTMSRSSDAPDWSDNSGQNYDVYEVTLPKHRNQRIVPDPEFDEAVATRRPVPRRFVRRVE